MSQSRAHELAVPAMLVSHTHSIAFAHYPKTAGTSLQRWFIGRFPDARLLVPDNPHYPVARSVQLMRMDWPHGRLHVLAPILERIMPEPWAGKFATHDRSMRVLGVIRDPLDMMVSLYEFWRRTPMNDGDLDPFIRLAMGGCFREFVEAAVVQGRLPTYEKFFDVGGPLWRNTTLLDFTAVDPALRQFCRREGISDSWQLPELNRAPSVDRGLAKRRSEVKDLLVEIRKRHRWYFEEGIHLALKGDR